MRTSKWTRAADPFTIGFTGTRHGMTRPQQEAVRTMLQKTLARYGASVLCVHGACVGADAEFDALCAERGLDVVCRPSDLPGMTASVTARPIAPPAAPLARNVAIVRMSSVLIARPRGTEQDEPRSGTWATIRQARRDRVPVRLVWPDGGVV